MKNIHFLFAFVIIVTLGSCGSKSNSDQGSSTGTNTTTTVTNEQAPPDTDLSSEPSRLIEKTVTSNDGLLMRDKPDVSGKLVVVMPYNSKVTILEENIKKDNILKVSGYWVKARYGRYEGFCFDGFLK